MNQALRIDEIAAALEQALIERGEIIVPVYGESMRGPFRRCDAVVVRRVAPASIRPGDVIAFPKEGRWAVHRVIRVSREGNAARYFVKGDRAREPDEPLGEGDVKGRVIAVVREGRRRSLDTPLRRLQAVGLAMWSRQGRIKVSKTLR